ncbi:hypothetical protein MRB53_018785 [Persea americana]|uniref:Uncharacterized protein n=1 Tax=Persea americana TaxID=3435 RepID=A0ACC2M8Z3_PERAE|nr:hypothetical protein MRB53_018785 [Persea americana]
MTRKTSPRLERRPDFCQHARRPSLILPKNNNIQIQTRKRTISNNATEALYDKEKCLSTLVMELRIF